MGLMNERKRDKKMWEEDGGRKREKKWVENSKETELRCNREAGGRNESDTPISDLCKVQPLTSLFIFLRSENTLRLIRYIHQTKLLIVMAYI